VEVLIQGEEAIGLEFPEDSAQLLLNSVDGVEEVTPVDSQAPATEFPIRAQQEMKLEDLEFKVVQGAPADQDEIRHILLVLAAPSHIALTAGDEFERDFAHVFLFCGAMAKVREATAKDGTQDAIAGIKPGSASETQPQAMTLGAGTLGERYCF
jgi:hypothetical protein